MSLPAAEIQYEQAHINQSVQPAGYAACTVIFGLSLASVVIRLIARRHKQQKLALDDILILFGLIFTAALYAESIAMIANGWGKHEVAISSTMMVQLLKWEVANVFTIPLALTSIRLSILMLTRRIFEVHGKYFDMAFYAILIYTVLWLIGTYIADGLQCIPFSSRWSLTNSCLPNLELEYSVTILSAIGDLAIFLLPQPIIWKLEFPLKRKIATSIVFFLGFSATFFGILKIAFVKGVPGVDHAIDYTYSNMAVLIVNFYEPCLGIIASCLPSTPAFMLWVQSGVIGRVTNRLMSNISSRSSNKSGGSAQVVSGSSTENIFGKEVLKAQGSLSSLSNSNKINKVYVRTDVSVNKEQTDEDVIPMVNFPTGVNPLADSV